MKTYKNKFLLLFIFLFLLLASGSNVLAAEKTIGVIMTGSIQYYKNIHEAFTSALPSEGLGSAGIILQSPVPEPMSWTNAARKLVAVGVDVIVTYGAPATLAAMQETTKIPIIFAGVYDPEGIGITAQNITGTSSKVPISSIIKNFRNISEFSTLGIIYSSEEKDTVLQAKELKQISKDLDFKTLAFNIKNQSDVSDFSGVDALFLTTGCAAMHCVNNITGLARKGKIPTATSIGGGEESGIILTISANPFEQGKEAAKMAAQVLKGVKPSSLPVGAPKKVDMIINLREANSLGLKVPFDILTAATKVIK